MSCCLLNLLICYDLNVHVCHFRKKSPMLIQIIWNIIFRFVEKSLPSEQVNLLENDKHAKVFHIHFIISQHVRIWSTSSFCQCFRKPSSPNCLSCVPITVVTSLFYGACMCCLQSYQDSLWANMWVPLWCFHIMIMLDCLVLPCSWEKSMLWIFRMTLQTLWNTKRL